MSTKSDSIIKGETVVDVNKIINLEQTIALKDQTIGALKQQITNMKEQSEKDEQTHKKELDRAQKEVIVKKASGANADKVKCPCGETYSNTKKYCPWCSRGITVAKPLGTNSTSYKNLDDVIENIRKEESKKLKVDIHELEQKSHESELQIDKLNGENERLQKRMKDQSAKHDEAITTARSEVRDRYQKELEKSEKRVKSLIEDIKKVKSDKTDELIEANRKKEIVELKARITELENDIAIIEAQAGTKWNLKAWLEKRRADRLTKEAMKERADKQESVEKASKEYPKNKSFWNFFGFPWGKEHNPYNYDNEYTWNI